MHVGMASLLTLYLRLSCIDTRELSAFFESKHETNSDHEHQASHRMQIQTGGGGGGGLTSFQASRSMTS